MIGGGNETGNRKSKSAQTNISYYLRVSAHPARISSGEVNTTLVTPPFVMSLRRIVVGGGGAPKLLVGPILEVN